MSWLDVNKSIVKWGAECLRIPYQMTHLLEGDLRIKEHSYFPDFYYEIKTSDGSIRTVVAEVKPKADYNDAMMFSESRFETPEGQISLKKLKSLEYKFKMAQKNYEKWQTMINWCNKKGYEFIIITEDHLKKFNL